MIIMARILTPNDYGLVGMLAIFISLSQSLIDCGFSQALIRKKDRSEVDNSTVFYFNIVTGIVLYLILFISAPLIADFYNEPILTPLTRLISLSVVINSLIVVQRALFTINIDFKAQAKASLPASIISGIIGIVMAYTGFGVWSIVFYQLSNYLINTLLIWILSKWRPKLLYSWKSFREMFSYGSKMTISGIIDTIYKNIYLIVIGKIYNASDLGFYTRAQQFADFPSSNLTGIIQRVTFPVLCSIQDDTERLCVIYRKFLRMTAFVIFPLMIGLAAVAHPFIMLFLNEQWEPAVTLLQILCFGMMWYPIHAINLNLLLVQGRSDLFLRLEIIKKFIGIAVLLATIPFGMTTICWGLVGYSLIALVINTYYTGRIIHIGFFDQLYDLMPTLLYSLSMGVIVLILVNMMPNYPLQLCVGIVAGVTYYFLIAKLTHSKDLSELKSFIQKK